MMKPQPQPTRFPPTRLKAMALPVHAAVAYLATMPRATPTPVVESPPAPSSQATPVEEHCTPLEEQLAPRKCGRGHTLTAEQKAEIYRRLDAGERNVDIARAVGVDPNTVGVYKEKRAVAAGEVIERQCNACRVTKPWAAFALSGGRRRSVCKDCTNAGQRVATRKAPATPKTQTEPYIGQVAGVPYNAWHASKAPPRADNRLMPHTGELQGVVPRAGSCSPAVASYMKMMGGG